MTETIEPKTDTQSKSERSPWVYTTVVLAFVSLGLLVSVLMLSSTIGGIATGKGGTAQAQATTQPQAAPQQPDVPSQPGSTDLGFSLEGQPLNGQPNAPVTIVEFSDFECPFCGRFFSTTLPDIDKNYIQTGKAKLYYMDFPLSFHPQAEPAALAAACAKEQNKFWEFHDKIFANQQSLSDESYKKWAKEIGLNSQQFDTCYTSKKYLSEVQSDFDTGSKSGVSGTPSFKICKGTSDCTTIVGAQPFSAFKSAIDSKL
ncbi:MAG: thioredoxin domain-containing protein [Candidatus Aenigmarchaeota archaeon]|nr:thioredoxin domain-containing protein [Candidatus Aenigmarchaeota archaeon]